ncbi:hypothetical protein L0V05_19860 [Tabrizicola sp. J26]|uniref:hypothetical protein n=1 Tax=Alitabrizicola rongguiensis TaxID=2909234 RepID=UPI001F1E2922|nr:hypothetical protein [Tabrizicola rongguiensis]MCF1711071.1 hypothetical protein [Tabrizicola rongguiensis]
MNWFSPEDGLIFIDADRVKTAAPWRLKDYGRGGALTDDQIEELATRFGLERAVLKSLSIGLAFALDPIANPSVVHMSQKVATDRAARELDKALTEAKVAERKLRQAVARLTRLYTGLALDREGAARLEKLKITMAETHRRSEEDLQQLRAVSKVTDVALVVGYTQKGQMQDRRRKMVMRTLFCAWQESGRKLTYSTDSVRKQRCGPLVDFVTAAVACVTDRPWSPSGETIVSDLREYLALEFKDFSETDQCDSDQITSGHAGA